MTLEDESGRIKLVGDKLQSLFLVTGCIIAAMGTENANGELEVIDIKFPDLAPQPDRWALSKPPATKGVGKPKGSPDADEEMTDARSRGSGGKIAIVSGLAFSGTDASHSLELNLLLEYLLGEALDPAAQQELAQVSRLIIAGNSISLEDRRPVVDESQKEKKAQQKKYGYDASSYNALPSQLLDEFLASLLPTMPVTLLPGAQDPATASYPQQPIHTAMFPTARAYAAPPASDEQGWFDTVTNPWEGELDGWRVLGTGGQNIDDISKYVDSEDRLGMMEATCRWRCTAPTAPDTLCKCRPLDRLPPSTSSAPLSVPPARSLMPLAGSYPFQDDDPFVMKTCPHLYFVGCQPQFGTRQVTGPEGQTVRLIAVPSFAATQEIVLVDSETLEVSTVKICTA